jgi:hypothetical protein
MYPRDRTIGFDHTGQTLFEVRHLILLQLVAGTVRAISQPKRTLMKTCLGAIGAAIRAKNGAI